MGVKIGLAMDEVGYIGNDTNDIDCLKAAGTGIAPADAHPAARRPQTSCLPPLVGMAQFENSSIESSIS